MQPTSPPSGERWNVNMPAVIGVVFVFLVGVVIWVIATSGDGGDAVPGDGSNTSEVTPPDESTTADGAGATTTPTSPPPDTTSAPTTIATTTTVPAPTTAPTSAPTTTSTTTPPTTAPVTAAPEAGDDAVPGDLAVPGVAMQRPPCDGGFITVLASPIGGQATASSVAAVLDDYPGSHYLRADQTCPSLSPSSGGEPIYVIFFGPFAVASDACAARAEGPADAYARQLSDEVGPDHSVTCD
jgi:hypothetical protein